MCYHFSIIFPLDEIHGLVKDCSVNRKGLRKSVCPRTWIEKNFIYFQGLLNPVFISQFLKLRIHTTLANLVFSWDFTAFNFHLREALPQRSTYLIFLGVINVFHTLTLFLLEISLKSFSLHIAPPPSLHTSLSLLSLPYFGNIDLSKVPHRSLKWILYLKNKGVFGMPTWVGLNYELNVWSANFRCWWVEWVGLTNSF